MTTSDNAAERTVPEPRLERWKVPTYLRLSHTVAQDGGDLGQQIWRTRSRYYETRGIELPRDGLEEWLRCSKEFIYDVVDGKPVIHVIAHSFNVDRGEVEIRPLLDILVAEPGQDVGDEIRGALARALFADVPVFPNTEELASEL